MLKADSRLDVRRAQTHLRRRTTSRSGATRPASTDELIARYVATHDRSVRNELVERCRPLASVFARQMRRRAEPLDDLEQVALVGILKAVERFDPTFGVTFKTYASATAIGELRRHYRDHGWTMAVPRWLKDLHVRAERATDELTASLRRPPTVAEVSERLGVSIDSVVEALDARDALRPRSMSGPAGDLAVEDAVGALTWDDEIDQIESRWTVRSMLLRLPPRERQIVALRYYGDLTQTEIAERMGISQVHVSRLLRASLTRMRRMSAPAVRGS